MAPLGRLGIALLLAAGALPGVAAGAERSPVQELSFYHGALHRPITEKVSLGNEALLDWQHHINLQYGQDIRPRLAAAGHPLIPEVRRMLAGLPPDIRRLASRYVVAVFLLQDDWGTGTTEAVRDAQGRWKYSYIALNLSVLNRTANAWGSWKENSAFRSDGVHRVRMILAAPAEDRVIAAIRFIFLHELGHALGLSLGAHGWWDAPELPAASRDSPYLRRSWRAKGKETMVSIWATDFPRLGQLKFYAFAKAKLPAAEAEGAYRDLARTNFPSLYGATNPFDDFAEAFAIYVHTRLLGKPYRVEVWRGEQRRYAFGSCIQTGRCARKVAELERLLGLR